MKDNAVYEKRLIAFVDVLGFSTLIEDSKVDTTLRRKIKNAMETIQKTVNEGIESSIRNVTTFSDSAVISYRGDEHSVLLYLLLDVIHLQLQLGIQGIMIRGGIAYGDCYHDGSVVFGPAMNEAYRLENKVADWPRVVIDRKCLDEAIEETVDHGIYTEKYELQEISSCLREDEDDSNLLYVDYLCQPQELLSFGDEYYEWLRDYRETIVKGLNRYSSRNKDLEMDRITAKRIFRKYRKILSYWNNVVGDDEAALPVPKMDKENQIKFRQMYKKLTIPKRYPYISV